MAASFDSAEDAFGRGLPGIWITTGSKSSFSGAFGVGLKAESDEFLAVSVSDGVGEGFVSAANSSDFGAGEVSAVGDATVAKFDGDGSGVGVAFTVSISGDGDGDGSGVGVAFTDSISGDGEGSGSGVGVLFTVSDSAGDGDGDASGVGDWGGVAGSVEAAELSAVTVADAEGSGVASGFSATKLGSGFGPIFSSNPSRLPLTFTQSCSINK